MKRTQLRAKTPLKARNGFKRGKHHNLNKKRATKRLTGNKSKSKGYRIPQWFNSIPYGSHGNTPAQKRYWKVISDLYRQEDYETYKGKCPVCHRFVDNWQSLQLGHFHRWSLCNSWFKFNRQNLLGICASCNVNDGGLTSYHFAEALKRKYGDTHIEWIAKENEKYRGQKMEVWEIVERVAKLRPDLVGDK